MDAVELIKKRYPKRKDYKFVSIEGGTNKVIFPIPKFGARWRNKNDKMVIKWTPDWYKFRDKLFPFEYLTITLCHKVDSVKFGFNNKFKFVVYRKGGNLEA